MMLQLFEALFAVTLVGLVAAPIAGLVLLAWPRKRIARPIVPATQVHV